MHLVRSWPMGLVALAFALVFCLLLWFFADSIEAWGTMKSLLVFRGQGRGGPAVLFMLTAGIMGGVSIAFLEYRLGTVGIVVFLFALPYCLAAIAGGFALGLFLLEGVPGSTWDMAAFSVILAVGVSAVRTYLHDVV